jgi:dTDP-4-amino-4,6-dideoxygalactose transaminase
MKKIYLSPPHMGEYELDFVKKAFATNWIAPFGPHLDAFENELSDYLGSDCKLNVVALSSGTAALHLALKVLNVGKEDVVLVQSFTFCGTSNPVTYLGSRIGFIDSELTTWNMCPIALKNAIEFYGPTKVKAIIPVHLYGMPARMNEILSVANDYNIPVIEDAAESLGSKYCGSHCGTLGVANVLSFNGNKIITTGGGGALISKNAEYVKRARFLSTQARDNAPHYQHSEIGYNYRLSNISAGIGLGQLKVIETRVMQRRANNNRYRQYFKEIKGVKFQSEPSADFYSNYWLTAILIDPELTGGITRETLRMAFEKANIESRPLWKPMHLQPVYSGSMFFGNGVCEFLFENGLCLPSASSLSEDDFQQIFTVLDSVFKK